MPTKRKKRSSGYHIARVIGGPPQRLLAENGKFTVDEEALLFTTSSGAGEYVKENGINMTLNTIVPCECSEVARERHIFKE
jgi:hypothetical protein